MVDDDRCCPAEVGMSAAFISYATADREEALAICEAIERRGVPCWIACRDVQPGENYQEAIVRAIRGAPAMVLVFSERANNSEEIKKELSLVSRYRVPLLAVRIEEVEPSDAFAYELSTRQWIDLFGNWDKALATLAARIEAIAQAGPDNAPAAPRAHHPLPKPRQPRILIAAIAGALLIAAAIGGYFTFASHSASAGHTMVVRLTGFRPLSGGLPPAMPDAIGNEIIAAFSREGVVGISTAPAPPPGDAAAYALGGTIQRDGDKIRVIANLVNERSGTTLWSNSFSYAADDAPKVPRWIAVAAGNVARCGLFGASTYSRPLTDPTMTAYLQFCHFSGEIEDNPGKALDAARRVVAALPDFSWGWSAVENGELGMVMSGSPDEQARARVQALRAADKAVQLDPSNSEALSMKMWLIDPADLAGRETLLKQALKARELACGCEHTYYGMFLDEVGRTADATAQYRRALDILSLNATSHWGLAFALAAQGNLDEAKVQAAAVTDVAGSSEQRAGMTIGLLPVTQDFAAVLAVLRSNRNAIRSDLRSAWLAGVEVLASRGPAKRAGAIAKLAALPPDTNGSITTAYLLAALGAHHEVLALVDAGRRAQTPTVRAWLFLPGMSDVRADPAFPGLADRLGLTRYWRTTRIKPDFCKAADAPAYCRTL